MKTLSVSILGLVLAALPPLAANAGPVPSEAWQERHDQLVARLRRLQPREGDFGDAYRPIYHAALPWYELWGGRNADAVDPDMVSPEDYAEQLATAVENGRNFIAENPNGLFPLVFRKSLPGGKEFRANYWLSLPRGFPEPGRAFPLVVDLHGSGWLGHKISYKARAGEPGPTFGVTPINMGGPWQIDFLNAYLDEVLAILPVDQDRVYVQGHSLGGEATWEWALDNPERFAAISPRAGIGEPYRASRLRHVPSWSIHGEDDDVIPYGFEEQMVAALLSQGASARISVLKGGEHNMPADLDQQQVLDWYLRQTRSHQPPPEDPRDRLGIGASGFSTWEIISLPAITGWRTQASSSMDEHSLRNAAKPLFKRAHDRGEAADSPLFWELDPGTRLATCWLAVPKLLHDPRPADPSASVIRASRYVRFYGRGTIRGALDHVQAIQAEVRSRGHAPSGDIWFTPLSLWQDTPNAVYEVRQAVD